MVLLDERSDMGFADGHLPGVRMAAVEYQRKHATSCIGHQRFEANDFRLDPVGLTLLAAESGGLL